MSAQRVAITMNPDGSITKRPPAPSSSTLSRQVVAEIDENLDLGHPAVSAPTRGPDLDGESPIPPAALQGLPIDAEAVAESSVTKEAVDDKRTHDVSELDGQTLNETKPIVNDVSKEDVWMLIRRFDQVSWLTSRAPLRACAKAFLVQQVEHVRAIDPHKKLHGGKLDLRLANETDDEFSPDKLRAALERLYLTIVSDLIVS
jgi:hypothetical protein